MPAVKTGQSAVTNQARVIFVLGLLTALSPFTIDMYLPAFPEMAVALHASVADISLSLPSYFAGIGAGQLCYGPLLDRFGRKKPLYFGLSLYLLASVGCMRVQSTEALIIFRFIQGLGGCAANVAAVAMVRDLFSVQESARVFSLLMLVVGASPLLAPTLGGLVATQIGWQAVFAVLMAIAMATWIAAARVLPASFVHDKTLRLRPGPVARNYLAIFREPQFYTYALSGALSLSGLFVYIAASPILFLELFKIGPVLYAWIFAGLAAGLIGASQVNLWLLKRWTTARIFAWAIGAQLLLSMLFLALAWADVLTLPGVTALLFALLAVIGLGSPNGTVLAMAPFARNAGSASALMSSLQMVMGAAASIGIGLLQVQGLRPIGGLFTGAALLACLAWASGRRGLHSVQLGEDLGGGALH